MGKLDRAEALVRQRVGVGLPVPGERRTRDQVKGLLDLTYDDDPRVRQVAIRSLCPCHIQGDVPEVWDRLLDLVDDNDDGVRHDVLHSLVDGSPRRLRLRVVQALEVMAKDRGIRRSRRQFAQEALRRYHRTGQLDPHA
ncbi:MAG TPA: HEAT repeat domain-containing protein [Acidimicrobiales bacterium]|nr:HEAT repeat domain-containing protein [Acidimicrobiales bacterium]